MSLVALSKLADDDDEVPEGHHVLYAMDSTGDTRIIWDPNNADDVANARRTFDDLVKKGYQAFSVRKGSGGEKGGDKGERVRTFDASLEKLILAPATVGG